MKRNIAVLKGKMCPSSVNSALFQASNEFETGAQKNG
jgi:hypothetical protein